MVCLLYFLLARFSSNKGFVLEDQLGFCLVTPDSHRGKHNLKKNSVALMVSTEFFSVPFLCILPHCCCNLLTTGIGIFDLREKI